MISNTLSLMTMSTLTSLHISVQILTNQKRVLTMRAQSEESIYKNDQSEESIYSNDQSEESIYNIDQS